MQLMLMLMQMRQQSAGRGVTVVKLDKQAYLPHTAYPNDLTEGSAFSETLESHRLGSSAAPGSIFSTHVRR